jgi:hypothetical protein
MNRVSLFITALSCLTLLGCGNTEDPEDVLIQPQSGDWTIVTTGWTNDDCNEEENSGVPNTLTMSDVDSPTFSMTFYQNEVRLADGNSSCTHSNGETYSCDEFVHTQSDADGTIVTMTGEWTVDVTSETTVSASTDLVLDCDGSDCARLATYTNSGSHPCGTTLILTAEVD